MPPTLRRTPGGSSVHQALSVLTDHARGRIQAECIWLFVHEPEGSTRGVLRSSARPDPGMSDAAAGTAAVRATHGRFTRRVGTVSSGVHVAASQGHGGSGVAVVAHGPAGEKLTPETQTALVDLAHVAARLLAEPEEPATAPEPASRPADDAATRLPRAAGYGAGLADALALLERPPVIAESRERIAAVLGARHPAPGDAVRIIETDIGLAVAVLRAANAQPRRPSRGVVSVPDALAVLGAGRTLELATALPVLRGPGSEDAVGGALGRMSAHAIATRAAADTVARHTGDLARDEIRVIALLHDVGKIALAAAGGDSPSELPEHAATPEERIAAERRRLGIDHATLGGLAVQRLGLPRAVSAAIEGHHAEEAAGAAGIVRLADMLAHQAHGHPVSAPALAAAGRRVGLGAAELQRFAYDIVRAGEPRSAGAHPSPLTPMQQRVLQGLAAGSTYKQIAAGLSLSESTVRSHVHKAYEKLDVADRAQAVLMASERGWI